SVAAVERRRADGDVAAAHAVVAKRAAPDRGVGPAGRVPLQAVAPKRHILTAGRVHLKGRCPDGRVPLACRPGERISADGHVVVARQFVRVVAPGRRWGRPGTVERDGQRDRTGRTAARESCTGYD